MRGQPERLVRAERADLERLDRKLVVVQRAGRTGEVDHRVQRLFDEDVLRHVVVHEAEVVPAVQMLDVVRRSGDQVVHGDHREALAQEPVAQMRAQESRSPGDQDRLFHFSVSTTNRHMDIMARTADVSSRPTD